MILKSRIGTVYTVALRTLIALDEDQISGHNRIHFHAGSGVGNDGVAEVES